MPTLPELLKMTVDLDGSDLHLSIRTPPQVRVDGSLRKLELPELTSAETKHLAYSVLTDEQKERFEETMELDFSFGLRGIARFRCLWEFCSTRKTVRPCPTVPVCAVTLSMASHVRPTARRTLRSSVSIRR